jgi:hypothetical protein
LNDFARAVCDGGGVALGFEVTGPMVAQLRAAATAHHAGFVA